MLKPTSETLMKGRRRLLKEQYRLVTDGLTQELADLQKKMDQTLAVVEEGLPRAGSASSLRVSHGSTPAGCEQPSPKNCNSVEALKMAFRCHN